METYGNLEKYFSFPAFITVLMSMMGLFWSGCKLAFRKRMPYVVFVSFICIGISFLLFQLLIMISGTLTNESANKVRSAVGKKDLKLKRDIAEENLTLWKIYTMDRSLVITSLATLLTYGILVGTLGKEL
ncbi:uncharacterized protein TNIN_419771 [Trichonephila inaurata madagascariensis]|uniref:DUF3899 domain-containing protein n=1 Tax=Trichonephila inaurata madagascariensis TaxID=2747483 RepID=A0A8X6ITN8_9ARAC|nr:uncharacterized protein TNIN_419771 [Trichonephila inaurata madagascariensis]